MNPIVLVLDNDPDILDEVSKTLFDVGHDVPTAAAPEIQLQHLLLAYGLMAQPALLPFRRSSVNVGAGVRIEPTFYRRCDKIRWLR